MPLSEAAASAFAHSRVLVPYGRARQQHGELFVPARARAPAPCVVLIHGGFWKQQYTRILMDAAAVALADRGWAVINLEYRTVGMGGGWPRTGDDVLQGIAALTRHPAIDCARTAWVGHSAGGQLALWAAGASVHAITPGPLGVPLPRVVLGLAPVSDMRVAAELQLGGGAVARLLEGGRSTASSTACPCKLLPLRVPVRIIHGQCDEDVPVSMTAAFVECARRAGDDVDSLILPAADHMELIDPRSGAWPHVVRILGEFLT